MFCDHVPYTFIFRMPIEFDKILLTEFFSLFMSRKSLGLCPVPSPHYSSGTISQLFSFCFHSIAEAEWNRDVDDDDDGVVVAAQKTNYARHSFLLRRAS